MTDDNSRNVALDPALPSFPLLSASGSSGDDLASYIIYIAYLRVLDHYIQCKWQSRIRDHHLVPFGH